MTEGLVAQENQEGPVGNLLTDCQSVHPAIARTHRDNVFERKDGTK